MAKQKYLRPAGRGNMLYLPPGCNSAALLLTELPLKKVALSLFCYSL
jgi:hypothetical protein